MFPLTTLLDSEILEAQSTLASRISRSTIKDLRQQCTLLGLVTGSRLQRLLIVMIKKFPNQSVIYEGFDHQDLLGFVASRGLELGKSAQRGLTKYESTQTLVIQAHAELQAKQSSAIRQPLSGSTAITLRRSSRLAAQPPHAFNKPPTVKASGHLAKPVKTIAKRNVLHLSPWKVLQKLQRSFKAAERRSKKSLVQLLEAADRELSFDFLRLPGELRNMVYHLVCISSTTITQPQNQPAIAKTCRLLRDEALAVYYGFNRFSVYVGSRLNKNAWFQTLRPCYLASVRSFSFTYVGAHTLLDVSFDIRGQKFSIVRRSSQDPSTNSQGLDQYLLRPQDYGRYEHWLVRPIEIVRMGTNTLQNRFPYKTSSSSLRATFNASINTRVGQAETPSAAEIPTEETKDWTLLSAEWQARKGFSASSIMRVAEMLAENKTDVKNLWVGELED